MWSGECLWVKKIYLLHFLKDQLVSITIHKQKCSTMGLQRFSFEPFTICSHFTWLKRRISKWLWNYLTLGRCTPSLSNGLQVWRVTRLFKTQCTFSSCLAACLTAILGWQDFSKSQKYYALPNYFNSLAPKD